ncbi:PilZ domain-containing protein [Acetivibrio clariflavus]|uniref:PilZ domain-containing protein n=1 Tax=Acetivibrio clariflavus (strain DSM 19732 / NBRC 101661 / EBR45) TaxID=720554 RepID=G8LY72_ACECE|nr:PilZ domain-containing protein [Acetivibrio clariflavus]AEV67803.1 PilZ domain-containing protein [Acetivibrio clariflavus DSM 19732]
MEIKAGDIVSVRHFSGTKLFKSLVLEYQNEIVKVRLLEDIALLNCSQGDPLVLGSESENEIYISSCTILNLNKDQNTIEMKIDSYETTTNKRLFVRFPVSLYAEARIGESQKKHLAIVKNISYSGMMIFSKADFPLYQELKFEIHAGSGIKINLKATVIRKVKEAYNFEYGLKIIYTDVHTPNLLKKYLMLLKKEQEESIKKFKELK